LSGSSLAAAPRSAASDAFGAPRAPEGARKRVANNHRSWAGLTYILQLRSRGPRTNRRALGAQGRANRVTFGLRGLWLLTARVADAGRHPRLTQRDADSGA